MNQRMTAEQFRARGTSGGYRADNAPAPDLLAAMQSIALIANGGHGTPATNLAGIFKKATEAIAKATK